MTARRGGSATTTGTPHRQQLTPDVERAVERAARDSYSRLVAFLAARSRDVAAAEDALADAFQAALETWPRSGVPEKPEAWLLTAAIALLYEGLVRLAPGIGALVGRAAAIAEARDAATGWALLQEIPAEAINTYQPYWALAAHLLRRRGQSDEAAEAYSRAIGLCEDQAMREFLAQQAA